MNKGGVTLKKTTDFRFYIKAVALILCLVLLAVPMTSCKQEQEDLFTQNGFSSIAVDAEGNLHADASFNSDFRNAHKGETVGIYELLPGEPLSALNERAPLAEAKVDTNLSFVVPPDASGRSRLYSTYFLKFSGGELFSDTGFRVQKALGGERDPLTELNLSLPKGLYATSFSDAAELGCGHAMVKIGMSELLLSPNTEIATGLGSYSVSSSALSRLDREILAATGAGLRVSLMVGYGAELSYARDAAILDFLSARYTAGANGRISAIYLDFSSAATPADVSRLSGYPYLALTSRVSNGSVFVVSRLPSVSDAAAFFGKVQEEILREGSFPWSASVSLGTVESAPWKNTDKDAMTVQNLPALATAISVGTRVPAAPASLSVCDVKISAKDENLQAAALAYLYRKALLANVSFVYYGSHQSADFGLRRADGQARIAYTVFSEVDGTFSYRSEKLCRILMEDVWEEIADAPNALIETGGAVHLGEHPSDAKMMFDFSDGNPRGFSAIGGLTAPECHLSESFGSDALYTWLEPDREGADTGVHVVIPNTTVLQRATSLSVRVLLQIPGAEKTTLKLRLTGMAPTGAPVQYEEKIEVVTGQWQTATFSVSAFASSLAPHSPCNLTLVSDDAPFTEGADNAYVLWLKDIGICYPEKDLNTVRLFAVIALGVGIGGGCALLLTYLISRRRRRHRR